MIIKNHTCILSFQVMGKSALKRCPKLQYLLKFDRNFIFKQCNPVIFTPV